MRGVERAMALLKAAEEVAKGAEATLSGVGGACFASSREQDDAFERARAKKAAADDLLQRAQDFYKTHGNFN